MGLLTPGDMNLHLFKYLNLAYFFARLNIRWKGLPGMSLKSATAISNHAITTRCQGYNRLGTFCTKTRSIRGLTFQPTSLLLPLLPLSEHFASLNSTQTHLLAFLCAVFTCPAPSPLVCILHWDQHNQTIKPECKAKLQSQISYTSLPNWPEGDLKD